MTILLPCLRPAKAICCSVTIFRIGTITACLNASWGSDQAAYTEGYRRGARLLVEYVAENARDQDFLVYPILFLYRHHIELALKNLVMQAPYLIDRDLTDVEKSRLGKHRLDWLWCHFHNYLA